MSFGPLKVTFKRSSMEAETDFGSLAELAGALQEQGAALIQMFGSDMEAVILNLGGTIAATETNGETNEQTAPKERKPRGPNKAKEVTPPNAPAPIPVDMTPGANGIPAGLARDPATNTAPAMAAAAPPPPPPPPPAAPPAPHIPPSGVLAGKIIPHMEDIAAKSPDGGKAWVDWLAQTGIVVAGATFEEAMKVIRMQPDDKLKPVADALQIAA
jgi:hypothetical protein